MHIGDVSISANFRTIEPEEFNRFAKSLERQIAEITIRTFSNHPKIEYSFEEGSLKSRVKAILAGSLVLYGAISQYPNFEEGVIKIHERATQFGQSIVSEFQEVTGVTNKDIRSKRTIPTDVKRLYRIVQNVKRSEQRLSPLDRFKITHSLMQDIAGLCVANPNDEAIWGIIDLLPRDKFPKLPATADEAIAIVENEKQKGRRARQPVSRSADRRWASDSLLAEQEMFPLVPHRTRPKMRYQNIFIP